MLSRMPKVGKRIAVSGELSALLQLHSAAMRTGFHPVCDRAAVTGSPKELIYIPIPGGLISNDRARGLCAAMRTDWRSEQISWAEARSAREEKHSAAELSSPRPDLLNGSVGAESNSSSPSP